LGKHKGEKALNDEEITTYTESALSDKFKTFFQSCKIDGNYKYVTSIDYIIKSDHIVEIDYNDLTNELKDICSEIREVKVHIAIYRAIGEVFQSRFGSTEKQVFVDKNFIKFKINNFEKFGDKIFGDPSLIYWDNEGDGKFEGEHKISNVVKQLRFENTFITIRESNEILIYNKKIYDNVLAHTLIKERTETLIPDCTEHNRNEVINKIKSQTFSNIESFDNDSNLITIDNGILNLETLELKPHTPRHLSRVLLPVEFYPPKYEINSQSIFEDIEKNLEYTLFWKFLTSSFTINGKLQRESFETALEITSAPIIKHQIDDKGSLFLGAGDNGKSILLSYITSLYGSINGAGISLQDIAEDKFMRANLDGKSFNIFTDLEKNELRHTGKIKAIVSGEPLEVQKKNKQGYTMTTFAKLMFSCNRFPRVFDQSQGFFRRWMIIKWQRNFENDPERNENLKAQLIENQNEKNKVFSCLVYLAHRLNKIGKYTHTKDWKHIQKEWNENADPIDDFDSNYILDSEHHKTKRETYQFYKKIMLEKGESPLGLGQFSKIFLEYHDEDRTEIYGQTRRVWLNIDFKEPKQENLHNDDTTS